MGFYLYRNETFPTLISVCLMACGIVSTFHHARRYDEPGWEKDAIRVMDLGFMYYYGTRRLFWLVSAGLFGYVRRKNDVPCVHAPFCFSGNSRVMVD
tara:strand:- start:1085 stop:1375 length:291 start_codon:yes stop_codon:yes gene_type:complete